MRWSGLEAALGCGWWGWWKSGESESGRWQAWGRGLERDGSGRRGCAQDCSDRSGEEIASGRGEGCVVDVASGVRSDEGEGNRCGAIGDGVRDAVGECGGDVEDIIVVGSEKLR